MMRQLLTYGVIGALAIFNGIYSSFSFTVFALQGIWYSSSLPFSLSVMFILSGVISGMLHFLVTGIPVAILEKILPLTRLKSGLLWIAVMLVPTFQTARHLGWL
jgi:hypothetical protein